MTLAFADTLDPTSGYLYDDDGVSTGEGEIAVTLSDSTSSGYITIASTATEQNGDISAYTQQVAIQTDYANTHGGDAPPLIIDGCLTDVTGNSEIFPRPNGTAILTLAYNDPKTQVGGQDCITEGHMEYALCSDGTSDITCTVDGDSSESHVSAASQDNYIAGYAVTHGTGTEAWDYLFDPYTLAQAKADADAASQRYYVDSAIPTGDAPEIPFVIYDSTHNFNLNQVTLGSARSPIVIIIPTSSSCPKLNGGTTVYGIVYYESSTACATNGWGAATIYGSVVFEGDVSHPSANSNMLDSSNLLGGGGTPGPLLLDDLAKLPGSWKDWQ